MIIPATVSGRKVTPRGVHLLAFGYHNTWMESAAYWLKLMTDTGMSWVVAKSDSDALRISGAAEALLGAGIIPIVRFNYTFPYPWTHADEVGKLAELYARYNAPLVVQFANEPYDDREWRNSTVPPEAEFWAIVRDRWNEAARQIAERGGYPGFPDGPGYDRNPFAIIGDPDHLWVDGKAVYLVHAYGKGRPVNYPYDDVSQNGTRLTWEQYLADLDDYADSYPDWNEGLAHLDIMNAQREAWAVPGKTALDDDTCFLAWEKVLHWSRETFGFEVPVAMTEGGWVPRDRPGSVVVDERWAMTTPNMVAKKTLAMYEYPSPLFAICPWLLADEAMGGGGWPFDAWVGWAYSERYGLEKPVIDTLRANAPGQPGSVRAYIEGARADIALAIRALQG